MKMQAELFGSKAQGMFLEVYTAYRASHVGTFEVKNIREARKLCKIYGWTAWNF
jgi:hypothetical protein